MILETLVDEQGLRYRDFMSDITGALLVALAGGQPHSPLATRLFRENLERITRQHVEQVSNTITKHVERVAEASLSASLVTLRESTKDELQLYTEALARDAIGRRTAHMAGEAGRAKREHSAAVWHMHRLMESGMRMENALAATRERYLMSREGQFTDASGRQWRGTHYVKVEAHGLLYRVWNDVMLTAAIAGGLAEVFLVHPEHEPEPADPLKLLESQSYLDNPMSRTRIMVDV